MRRILTIAAIIGIGAIVYSQYKKAQARKQVEQVKLKK